MRLVTIRISHFCEKARWALERARLPYVEEPYAPGVHLLPVRRARGRAGGAGTPVLIDGDVRITDSTDILEFVQRHPAAAWRPWPDGVEGDAARKLEARFDDDLGPHTRRVAYFYLLPDRALTTDVVARGVPGWQRTAFALGFVAIRAAMRRSMRIDAAGAERSRVKVEAVLDDVGKLLSDGRRYLTGDRFTGADLAFAALAGPLVLPPRYLDLSIDRLPAPLAQQIRAWHDHPALAHARRLWVEDRDPPGDAT